MEHHNLYTRPVLELVTVATEYCRQLEACGGTPRARFIEVMRPLLTMLYLKASMLPTQEPADGFNPGRVTEADYDYIRTRVADIMTDADAYLDVFVEDFKYSDTPVLCTVSEYLADVYQALRDFVEIVKDGHEEAVSAALGEVKDGFETGWGIKILSVIRALHDTQFARNDDF